MPLILTASCGKPGPMWIVISFMTTSRYAGPRVAFEFHLRLALDLSGTRRWRAYEVVYAACSSCGSVDSCLAWFLHRPNILDPCRQNTSADATAQAYTTDQGTKGVCIVVGFLENVGTPGPIFESVRHPIDASPWRSSLPQFARRRDLEPTHLGSSTGILRFLLPQQTQNPPTSSVEGSKACPGRQPPEEAFPNSPETCLRVVP